MKNPFVFQPLPRREAQWRLFCFHPAGYGAAMYRDWGKLLSPRIEVCAVRLPGRENVLGEPLLRDFASLVEWICATVRPFLDRPYAVFGHSMGAWVAFETARALQSRGSGATHVFASARHGPSVEKAAAVQSPDDADLVNELQRIYQGIPGAVVADPELLRMMLPILRADIAALESYRYNEAPLLECPITCFAGREDAEVSDADLQSWRGLTSRQFETRRFPGSHFYIAGAAREQLLRHIEVALTRTPDAATPKPQFLTRTLSVDP